jgi:NADPH:quinone reductase-like Zn-dependent oxidoreductase
MRAVQQFEFGGTEVLRLVDLPEPSARPGRVRVRVTAAGVNPADVAARAGWLNSRLPDLKLPFILGSDLAGTVIDDGGPFPPGTRVAALSPWFITREGTYAEVVSVDPAWLAEIPPQVDDVTAAAVPLAAQTGLEAIDQIGVAAGRTVLVLGASGAVGSFAVQESLKRRARVLAVASAGDEQYVAGFGVEAVLPRPEAPEALVSAVRGLLPDGVDAVFDAAGVPGAIGAVRTGGVFGSVVAAAMPEPSTEVDVRHIQAHSDGKLLQQILADIADGSMRVRVGLRLPLDRVAEAHAAMQSRSVRGKIVLTL